MINTHHMNGLTLLEKVIDGVLPGPTMAVTIPMKLKKVEAGGAEFQVRAGDMHLNPMGGVHGGFAATVLDSATGCAVHTLLEAGESYGTVDLNVKMMRPVPRDTELRAIGKVINRSKRLGISEGRLIDTVGRIYAHATATCMIFSNEKSGKVVELNAQNSTHQPVSLAENQ